MNGSEGYRLAIDFSVPDVLLDNFLVVGAGMELHSRGEKATIDYYGSKEKVSVVYLDTLEVGEASQRAVRALIIEGEGLGASEGMPTYGRIGMSFLSSLRLTVHYPRKLLLIEPSPEKEIPEGGAPFRPEGRFLVVDARLNGTVQGKFVVDPAASVTVIDRDWAEHHRLADGSAKRVEMATLEIGGFVGRRVPVLVDKMKRLAYRGRADGVIGASLLRGLAVTYDFPRRLLWLRQEGPSI